MPSCTPAPPDYSGTPFIPERSPRAVAALLSANGKGVIAPPDAVRWFHRDINELQSRNLVQRHRMRDDRLWSYRLTVIGECVKESFEEDGYVFDGFDVWLGERLIR